MEDLAREVRAHRLWRRGEAPGEAVEALDDRAPGLEELGQSVVGEDFMDGVESLTQAAGTDESRVLVRRISEEMQKDESLMSAMRRVGALPDKSITVVATPDGVLVGSGGETAEIAPEA
ncbi:MAG: dihydrofolate reductase, partial [candidate division NC10 bacterium]